MLGKHVALTRNSVVLSRLLDGFPEGLLAQPIYGWVEHRCYRQPV